MHIYLPFDYTYNYYLFIYIYILCISEYFLYFFLFNIYAVELEISRTKHNLYEYNTLGLFGAIVKHFHNRHYFPHIFLFVFAYYCFCLLLFTAYLHDLLFHQRAYLLRRRLLHSLLLLLLLAATSTTTSTTRGRYRLCYGHHFTLPRTR